MFKFGIRPKGLIHVMGQKMDYRALVVDAIYDDEYKGTKYYTLELSGDVSIIFDEYVLEKIKKL